MKMTQTANAMATVKLKPNRMRSIIQNEITRPVFLVAQGEGRSSVSAGNFASNPTTRESARLDLANAILSVATANRDVQVVKKAALEVLGGTNTSVLMPVARGLESRLTR